MASKYKAKKTVVDGITFDSKKEAARYCVLKGLVLDGTICELEVHPVYQLVVNGVLVCKYEADSRYVYTQNRQRVVEDVKGFKTDVYRLKKKLMKACLGIDVHEV